MDRPSENQAASASRDLGSSPASQGNGDLLAAREATTAVLDPIEAPADGEDQGKSAVAALGRQALEGSEPSKLIACGVELGGDGLGLDYCQLWELLPDREAFRLRGARGWDPSARDRVELPLDPELEPGFTLQAEGPVVVPDFSREQRFAPPPYLGARDVVSGISVKIPGPERPFGVLGGHSARRRDFSRAEVEFFEALSHVLGAAIDRSRFDEHIDEADRRYRTLGTLAEHVAARDDLTGLLNRRSFEERLEAHVGTGGRPTAVVTIDVDNLRFVNDSLGHSVGDRVLAGVANMLRGVSRPGTVTARLGGAQFGILLPGAREEVARRIGTELLLRIRTRDRSIPVTASAGVAVSDPDGSATASDLMVAADRAVFEAKEQGGDRVEAYTGHEGHRLAWADGVRKAIDEDRFVVHAQPIVDLGTGEPSREELLVRMVDTDGSVISPASFLPTGERFGLVREIDRWVISRALELVEAGANVAVNLSGKSLSDTELIAQVERGVEDRDIPAYRLGFEVTETAAAAATQGLNEFGWRIGRLGCPLALDDFGTGFGTFTYLKHLPVASVKIAPQFVRDLTRSPDDRRVVRSIVAAANSLGVDVVGEGVEDGKTLDLLREYGVGFAQGYHLGGPRAIA